MTKIHLKGCCLGENTLFFPNKMEKLLDKTLLQEMYTEIEQTLLKGVLQAAIFFIHFCYHYIYESL